MTQDVLDKYYESEEWQNYVLLIHQTANLIMKNQGYHTTISKGDADIVLRAVNLISGIVTTVNSEVKGE